MGDIAKSDKPLTPERKHYALKDQSEALELSLSTKPTFLILVASHVDSSRNSINKISCKRGIPIRGYVYDSKADAYFCECYDYIQVGSIPISMNLSVQHSSWSIKVPLTDGVILKFLNDQQFRDVDHFRSLFSPDEYSLEYLQLVDPK